MKLPGTEYLIMSDQMDRVRIVENSITGNQPRLEICDSYRPVIVVVYFHTRWSNIKGRRKHYTQRNDYVKLPPHIFYVKIT